MSERIDLPGASRDGVLAEVLAEELHGGGSDAVLGRAIKYTHNVRANVHLVSASGLVHHLHVKLQVAVQERAQ